MSGVDEDPRCPECGEPIGMTATYCMHCSADLTDERAEDDAGAWGADPSAGTDAATSHGDTTSTGRDGEQLLDPDGLVDNTLTVVVGVAGGVVVGLVGTAVFLFLTGSGWAILVGLLAWLGATAYLVRRRTVQAAVSKTGYAVAAVFLLVPAIALSPVADVEGGLAGRGSLLVVLLFVVALPAGVAAAIGWLAGRFVPEGRSGTEG